MAEHSLQAAPAEVINLADYRTQPPAPPAWQHDIDFFSRWTRVLKTEHDAEAARIDFECKQRAIEAWWEGPRDIIHRIAANNEAWDLYRAALRHLASLPAVNREQAIMKRAAVGKLWLRGECQFSHGLRAGCEADDHLFPPSARLGRVPTEVTRKRSRKQ